MGCDTLRCSCSKAGLDCSNGCGGCGGICANMYENIIEDNEYDEETYKHIICQLVNALCHYVLVYRINRNNQMDKTLITFSWRPS